MNAITLPSEVSFLKTADVARLCGVSSMTVTRWRRCGKIPAAAFADAYSTFWNAEVVREWLAAGRPWSDESLRADAGEASVQRALDAEADDRQRLAIQGRIERHAEHLYFEDWQTVQNLVVEMRKAADTCEAILNEAGFFQGVDPLQSRRAEICGNTVTESETSE